jgi:hypothetical protein
LAIWPITLVSPVLNVIFCIDDYVNNHPAKSLKFEIRLAGKGRAVSFSTHAACGPNRPAFNRLSSL